jgi:hypothetical protein
MLRDRRCRTIMKFMAKTVVGQNAHLAKLVKANDFESALDEGKEGTERQRQKRRRRKTGEENQRQARLREKKITKKIKI